MNKTQTDPHIDAAQLVAAAIQARDNAYAPYSSYRVGAAILTADGRVVTGCNVENAVYPLTICAERVAIAAAIAGGARHIVAVAVATENGGTPCGACRQVMREFGHPDMPIYIAKTDGTFRQRVLDELLPESFSAADLEAHAT